MRIRNILTSARDIGLSPRAGSLAQLHGAVVGLCARSEQQALARVYDHCAL
ncbi:hypothetical protein DPMN_111357 [Dreissena polymorpha]|uniref:Uncharacterized protein n=1 Tax=Dreissena polymorpha TaxID=45954 RepID=A0A9D4KDR5_DREPO|nr:hypothetical protein DPMN_111357 [Dreissena polymorpha]